MDAGLRLNIFDALVKGDLEAVDFGNGITVSRAGEYAGDDAHYIVYNRGEGDTLFTRISYSPQYSSWERRTGGKCAYEASAELAIYRSYALLCRRKG